MRPLVIPTALWPVDPFAIPGRPWWAGQRNATGAIRYIRTDGEHYEGLSGGSPADALDALTMRDVHKPVTTPPPCEGQVWMWQLPDGTLIKRTILGTVFKVVGTEVELIDVVWSIEGVQEGVWPPPGGQLLDGPFSPWSPCDRVSLADMVPANGAPVAEG